LLVKLIVNKKHLSSQKIVISGHCEIDASSGIIFGKGSGRGVISATNNYQMLTSFSAVAYADYPASTGYNNTVLTVVDGSVLNSGDVIFVKDSVDSAYSTTSSPLAEIATVVAVSGSQVYLDCRLRRQAGYTSGSIYRLDKNTLCRVYGTIYGDYATVRGSALSIKGYVSPSINLVCKGNSSAGLLMHSCLRGDYSVIAKSLDNKPSENRLGYGVISYGACKAGNVSVLASDVRHAYTDGVWGSTDIDSGNVLDMTITGVCNSATAAAWDTHPDSDGTVFNNIQAFAGHNDTLQSDENLLYALQIRSTNITVDGLKTDLDRCMYIRDLKHVDSVNHYYNIEHKGKLIGSPDGANRLYGIVYAAFGSPNNPISQSANAEHIFKGCDLTTVEYSTIVTGDKYFGCSFDWGETTLGWPDAGSPGGLHEFHDCNIYYPKNLSISNDEYRIYGTTVYTSGATFNLLDGAKLTAVNSGVECGSSANSAFAYTTISSGAVEFKYAGVFVNDTRTEGTVRPFRNNSTGGIVNLKDITVKRVRESFAAKGDTDATLKVGENDVYQYQTAALTADRTFTLSTTGALEGDKFHITRTSSGAFALNVGGLKNLAPNEWCMVVFNGTVWILMAYGSI
jgi:hypothetical protein